ncbi:MAG TPA: dihydropteroate synthase [Trueperaceae bacterium]
MHELRFPRPVPGAEPTAGGGYALRWQGAALMGIVNVTPDSFSDAGRLFDPDIAVAEAKLMRAAGARFLDVGGESSRPGAEPLSATLELERVLPVIRRLSQETDAVISVDTYKPEVAAAALKEGAHLINDIRGLPEDMRALCAAAGAPAIIMHMQGEPRTMQHEPSYQDVATEVFGFLDERAHLALAAGVPDVILDPGIGFGKTIDHNLVLLRELDRLVACGHPVLVGASRKKTIEYLTGAREPGARDPGSIALHLFSQQKGAALLRVHNVADHAQALAAWQAVAGPDGARG